MKEMRKMMMRTKMEFMKDFLMSPPRPKIPEFTFESVIKHAEFLFSQILGYQQAGDADEKKYMDSPLIKRICELAGVQKASIKKSSKLVVDSKQSQKPKFESPMVTPLVRDGALRWEHWMEDYARMDAYK